MMTRLTIPRRPRLPAPFVLPVRSLTRAAYLLRGVLVEALQREPLGDLSPEREQVLLLADEVVDEWADYFGVAADGKTEDDNADGR
jgi:hypothetical protein